MSTLRTAGELRGFLADVLIGIQAGTVDVNKANAIAKVSAQINQSLAVEVNTALQLEKMGKGHAIAGSMVIAQHQDDGTVAPAIAAPAPLSPPVKFTPPPADKVWCEQCDLNVTAAEAAGCKSTFCKAKVAA